MAHGEKPNMKRVKGTLKSFCETCDNEMKVINRCELHGNHEQKCYFCHLQIEHLKPDETNKSSRKESPIL